MEMREFTKQDWFGYSGATACETFRENDGAVIVVQQPFIGFMKVETFDDHLWENCPVIVDANGITISVVDGEGGMLGTIRYDCPWKLAILIAKGLDEHETQIMLVDLGFTSEYETPDDD